MKNIASPWLRVLAGFLDNGIYLAVFLLVVSRIAASVTVPDIMNGVFALVVWVIFVSWIWLFVNCCLVSVLGGTLGKIICGLAIVSSQGKNVSFWRAFLRNYVGYFVSGMIFWAGFFWMFRDKERRSWHDQIADTFVVVKNQTGGLIGIICLVLLVLSNLFLFKGIATNFAKNRADGVYAPIGQMVQELQKSSSPSAEIKY